MTATRTLIGGTLAVLAASLLALAMAAPAGAHFVEVDPPGEGEGTDGWVGGPPHDDGALPESAQGEGLMEHPAEGQNQPAAHGEGLNAACEALRDNGNGAVDIYGPPPKAVDEDSACPHGQ